MEGTAHKIASILRSIAGTSDPKYPTSAVIAAAGASTRMGGDTPKLLLDLCGMPVIVRTLLAYESCDCINEIVVVTRKDDIPLYEEFRTRYNIAKLTKIVEGGETRADSVRNGLDVISPDARFIAIADGARALVTPEIIAKVCHSAYLNDCATAATRVQDTIKIGDAGLYIESTPERKNVWSAQTPQVFRVSVYRAASYAAQDEKFKSTDDNQLVEHIRYPVKLVECGSENIKITTPFDMICARAIIEQREAAAQVTPTESSEP